VKTHQKQNKNWERKHWTTFCKSCSQPVRPNALREAVATVIPHCRYHKKYGSFLKNSGTFSRSTVYIEQKAAETCLVIDILSLSTSGCSSSIIFWLIPSSFGTAANYATSVNIHVHQYISHYTIDHLINLSINRSMRRCCEPSCVSDRLTSVCFSSSTCWACCRASVACLSCNCAFFSRRSSMSFSRICRCWTSRSDVISLVTWRMFRSSVALQQLTTSLLIPFCVITGPPNGPVLFCTLSSVGVVCRRL